MTTQNINVEQLISLIQRRPAIWDKTLDIYKDKYLRNAAWQEICTILNEDFENMDDREKQNYVRVVVKRWNNTRDCWIRSINEKKNARKRGSSGYVRNYIYHNQMLFLKKIFKPPAASDTANDQDVSVWEDGGANSQDALVKEENISNQYNISISKDPLTEEQDNSLDENLSEFAEDGSTSTKRNDSSRPKFNELDKKMCEFIDQKINREPLAENRNLLFFKSLLPSLVNLQDDEILEFHVGVLNLLQIIKNRKKSSLGHSST